MISDSGGRAFGIRNLDIGYFQIQDSQPDEGTTAMAKIRPLEDRVVIQQIEAEEKTSGGIVLPDTAKEKPQRGKVISVGPGRLLDNGERAAIGVVEGDEVLFGKYSGTEIKVDGEEIKILRETDILAKILK